MTLRVLMSHGQPPVIVIEGMDSEGELGPVRTIPNPRATADYRHFSCEAVTWDSLVVLGRQHGWVPAGTSLDQVERHQPKRRQTPIVPDYTPEGDWIAKRVLAEDARAWAEALTGALGQLQAQGLQLIIGPSTFQIQQAPPAGSPAPRGALSPAYLQDFIAFLRKGTFLFYYDDY